MAVKYFAIFQTDRYRLYNLRKYKLFCVFIVTSSVTETSKCEENNLFHIIKLLVETFSDLVALSSVT